MRCDNLARTIVMSLEPNKRQQFFALTESLRLPLAQRRMSPVTKGKLPIAAIFGKRFCFAAFSCREIFCTLCDCLFVIQMMILINWPVHVYALVATRRTYERKIMKSLLRDIAEEYHRRCDGFDEIHCTGKGYAGLPVPDRPRTQNYCDERREYSWRCYSPRHRLRFYPRGGAKGYIISRNEQAMNDLITVFRMNELTVSTGIRIIKALGRCIITNTPPTSQSNCI
jgi:hypothetical protein